MLLAPCTTTRPAAVPDPELHPRGIALLLSASPVHADSHHLLVSPCPQTFLLRLTCIGQVFPKPANKHNSIQLIAGRILTAPTIVSFGFLFSLLCFWFWRVVSAVAAEAQRGASLNQPRSVHHRQALQVRRPFRRRLLAPLRQPPPS